MTSDAGPTECLVYITLMPERPVLQPRKPAALRRVPERQRRPSGA